MWRAVLYTTADGVGLCSGRLVPPFEISGGSPTCLTTGNRLSVYFRYLPLSSVMPICNTSRVCCCVVYHGGRRWVG